MASKKIVDISDFIEEDSSSASRIDDKYLRELYTDDEELADRYLQFAEMAETPQEALKYAKKAFKLQPEDLYAERMVAVASAKSGMELLENLQKTMEHGKEIMKRSGYFKNDEYSEMWSDFDARAYVYVQAEYMTTLINLGMFRAAEAECEKNLIMCPDDNLRVRFYLMHIYAVLEDEESALKLFARFNNQEETKFLLPLTALYYKLNKFDEAKKYLLRLVEINKDTKKFFKTGMDGKLNIIEHEITGYSFRPFTIDELLMAVGENKWLYMCLPDFFRWGYKLLSAKKKQ